MSTIELAPADIRSGVRIDRDRTTRLRSFKPAKAVRIHIPRSYTHNMMRSMPAVLSDPSEERIRELSATRETWSVELGIPALDAGAAALARTILSLIDPHTRADQIRIFPSEHAGLTMQRRRAAETRTIDVDPGQITAHIHDRSRRAHEHYTLDTPEIAAAFLTA